MKIGAVVILYKPQSIKTYLLIETILEQVDVLCIIDNSPEPTPLNVDRTGLHYHHFSNNVGVAAGHNIGLRDLQSSNCDYGVLFDQDSNIDKRFINNLAQLITSDCAKEQSLVAIGPRVICSFSEKKVAPRIQKEIALFESMVCVTQIISSGMMIDLSKIKQIGFKDEDLFIDGVDHEWCWRAKTHNHLVAIAEKVEMVHQLGDARSKFAGVTYKVGSPIRLYYQFRNIFILCRRSYVPTYWKIRNLLCLPLRFIANAILQTNRRRRFLFMLCGICDGILNRKGSYIENWQPTKNK